MGALLASWLLSGNLAFRDCLKCEECSVLQLTAQSVLDRERACVLACVHVCVCSCIHHLETRKRICISTTFVFNICGKRIGPCVLMTLCKPQLEINAQCIDNKNISYCCDIFPTTRCLPVCGDDPGCRVVFE